MPLESPPETVLRSAFCEKYGDRSTNPRLLPIAFTFTYDADHNRLSQTATVGGVTTTTAYLNDPVSGAMSEEVTTNGAPSYVDYLKAGGQIVAQRTLTLSAAAWGSANLGQFNWAGVSAGWDYFTLDHLGSVAVVTDASGNVVQHLSYDAWGRQRNANGSAAACGTITPPTARGYTNQEQVPGGCLVNLNARLYDAEIGRMMSPDPIVGSPYIAQELNRYSYVINNPLSLTDPSGLCFLGCFWKSAVFRDIFAIAVVFVFQQYEVLSSIGAELGLYASAPLAAIANGGILGGIGGFIASGGTLKGAALGILQGALFAGAGNLLDPENGTAQPLLSSSTIDRFVAHGLVGGITSVAGGGKFGSGFLAGGVEALGPEPNGPQTAEDTAEGVIEHAALGGLGSTLGGGKFENGAITGAFGYLLNACQHHTCWASAADVAAFGSGGPYGFWNSMCNGGDPFACSAKNIAANAPPNVAGAAATAWLMDAYQNAHATQWMLTDDGTAIPLNGQMTSEQLMQYSDALAKAYIDYLGSSEANGRWPSWNSINQLHWNENGQIGVGPSGYAATPFGTLAPNMMKGVICPKCGP